ncbi:hypothetical protein CWI39_0621p0010 [Hamiltosporidium magnivora]|uniref:Uncharacterized protein n=1 Tax=Hamiltosporidium magnivora TaxID=148818 RepID=A0A4Q9LFW6_9MICR|nr:hypothetical protein CWI39_0621p0010 [Hamiltosporidium magnivora]
MLFFSHNTDYFHINASKNLYIDNIYEIIISSVHITDKIHNLLENVVFENLKCIYILDSTIETTNKTFLKKFNHLQKINVICNYFDEENVKSFITNSNLCATVVVKKYIFVSDFDEKIRKLIHLENSVSSQNGKRFIIETNTILEEIEELFFFKKNIVDLHISFHKTIFFLILVFLEPLENLKTLKVDFFSIVAKQNLFSEVLSFNKIYEIEIEEYKIDKQKICKILNNNTILEFSFLTEETCDSLSLPFLLKSLKNLEKVYLNGDHIYKILFLKNFIQFIATKTFKVVSIISKYSMKSCQNFDFDTDITENLCLGSNFPDGTIRNIFFKKRMIRLKTPSLYGFYIGKNDKKMLGNLENLISFDLINCFLLENSFSELFDEEKKGIYFERLEYYRFAAIDSCYDDAQIVYFTEEFEPNIFSSQTVSYLLKYNKCDFFRVYYIC